MVEAAGVEKVVTNVPALLTAYGGVGAVESLKFYFIVKVYNEYENKWTVQKPFKYLF